MAEIIDLNASSNSTARASCDVCVIGAGAAGLYLANRLSRGGRRVVVLEAGGATCASGAAIGIEAASSDGAYRGATEGRAFGWGGSTSRWGGLLFAHSGLDIRDETGPETIVWQHIVDVVLERSSAVFSTLALTGTPDFFSLPEAALGRTAKLLHDCGLETGAAEFLPFRRRNLTYLASVGAVRNLTVYLNAVASQWRVVLDAQGSGRVTEVEAVSAGGRRLQVSAASFVVAAGAIESARILLEIDRSVGERMLSRSARVGWCLSDHLSCAIAEVRAEDREMAAALFGPVFSRGRMRSFRFFASPGESAVPRHFAHFIFDTDNPGFRLAKDVLYGIQAGSLPNVRPSHVVDGLGGLWRLAYDRYVRSRLFIPPHTPAHLQMDIEQTPDPANRVTLGDERDRYGRPVAVVKWRVNEVDHESIRMLSRRVMQKWPDRSLGFPRLVPIDLGDAQSKPYDAYHPVGTCRMGAGGEDVVTRDLRVNGTQNLYVLSTAVFPSAGTANPTFSMLCLGDALADKLANSKSAARVAETIQ